MYIRKSVGPRMEPWETPALTRYSWEDFPSRTTWSCQLLRKEEVRSNIWHEIPLRLKFVKRISMPDPVENLGYIKCHNLSNVRPVKKTLHKHLHNKG